MVFQYYVNILCSDDLKPYIQDLDGYKVPIHALKSFYHGPLRNERITTVSRVVRTTTSPIFVDTTTKASPVPTSTKTG